MADDDDAGDGPIAAGGGASMVRVAAVALPPLPTLLVQHESEIRAGMLHVKTLRQCLKKIVTALKSFVSRGGGFEKSCSGDVAALFKRLADEELKFVDATSAHAAALLKFGELWTIVGDRLNVYHEKANSELCAAVTSFLNNEIKQTKTSSARFDKARGDFVKQIDRVEALRAKKRIDAAKLYEAELEMVALEQTYRSTTLMSHDEICSVAVRAEFDLLQHFVRMLEETDAAFTMLYEAFEEAHGYLDALVEWCTEESEQFQLALQERRESHAAQLEAQQAARFEPLVRLLSDRSQSLVSAVCAVAAERTEMESLAGVNVGAAHAELRQFLTNTVVVCAAYGNDVAAIRPTIDVAFDSAGAVAAAAAAGDRVAVDASTTPLVVRHLRENYDRICVHLAEKFDRSMVDALISIMGKLEPTRKEKANIPLA